MTFSIIILILIFSKSLYIVSYCYSLKLVKVYLTIRFFESFSESLVQFCLIIFYFVNPWLEYLCLVIYILCVFVYYELWLRLSICGHWACVNIWYDIICVLSYELYNNLTSVYLKKSIYARDVKRKV